MKVNWGKYSVIRGAEGEVPGEATGGGGGGADQKFSEKGGAKKIDVSEVPTQGQVLTKGKGSTMSDFGSSVVAGKAVIDPTGPALKGRMRKLAQSRIRRPISLKDLAKRSFSAGKGMSEGVKRLLLDQLNTSEAKVDWRAALEDFFDSLGKEYKPVWKKRFIGGGTYLKGRRETEKPADTFETVVCAVDTSSSISREVTKTFLTEVLKICEEVEAKKMIIIYCSDDIGINGTGGIDEVDLEDGEKPDFSKWCTTHGNAKGFLPPFEWLEENDIVPSVMIYLTDTGGQMPDPNLYNISEYADRTIWYICGHYIHSMPPFGEIIKVPLEDIK